MSSVQILKELLKGKMKLAGEVINLLPQDKKKHVENLQRSFLLAVSEAVNEQLREEDAEAEKKGVKAIPVE